MWVHNLKFSRNSFLIHPALARVLCMYAAVFAAFVAEMACLVERLVELATALGFDGWLAKLLFAAERKVCNQIFEGFDLLNDRCFAEVTKNSVSMLLSFGEASAKSKRSPEKLFVLLNMYEIMQELRSEVWALLSIMNFVIYI
ncbi:hypothetical protein K1719_040033 [Acacia pycnantha]|nr:hypothetical protein K1719_040033 [Acacia pycnantha]